jgi:hypothetical protein
MIAGVEVLQFFLERPYWMVLLVVEKINSGGGDGLLEKALSDGGGSEGEKPRLFDAPECKGCVFKGSRYCWNECPYNVWRKY